MVTRRTLLKSAAFGALAQSTLARQAKALVSTDMSAAGPSAKEPHFFVYVQMQGAWDPCLAFDPKDRSALLPNGERAFDQPYSIDEVRTFGSIPLAPQGFVLGKYADRMAVINGIEMEVDTGHTAGTIMSGVLMPRASGSPFVQAVVARRQSYLKHCSMPHIYSARDGEFVAGPYNSTSVVAAPADIVTMVGLGGGQSDDDLAKLQLILQDFQQTLTTASERRLFQSYVAAVPATINMRAQLRAGKFVPPAESTTAAGMGQLFGQLFALGIVGSVTWQLGLGGTSNYNFDTHSDHFASHPLGKAMADVDTLATELGKIPLDDHTSVWDRTTVVLSSEFSRTARLNSSQGKDHNVHSNSLVLLGYKVRAGVYGASGTRVLGNGSAFEAHAGLPVDLATGQPSSQGELLKTKHLWAGFGAICGIDTSREFGTDAKPVGFFT